MGIAGWFITKTNSPRIFVVIKIAGLFIIHEALSHDSSGFYAGWVFFPERFQKQSDAFSVFVIFDSPGTVYKTPFFPLLNYVIGV